MISQLIFKLFFKQNGQRLQPNVDFWKLMQGIFIINKLVFIYTRNRVEQLKCTEKNENNLLLYLLSSGLFKVRYYNKSPFPPSTVVGCTSYSIMVATDQRGVLQLTSFESLCHSEVTNLPVLTQHTHRNTHCHMCMHWNTHTHSYNVQQGTGVSLAV